MSCKSILMLLLLSLAFFHEQFDLYCDSEAYSHLATSLVFVSWAIGAVVLGWTSDR